jgi:hypothetical protein
VKKKRTDAQRPGKRVSPFDDPNVEWISKGYDPKGALVRYLDKDGKPVWKRIGLRYGKRKASKKEAREFMKMAREGFGLVTIGKKRRKSA